MKLFGNSQKAARTKKAVRKSHSDDTPRGWRGLSKGKRAAIIVVAVLILLVVSSAIFLRAFVKPPEPVAPIMVPQSVVDPKTGETVVKETPVEDMKTGFYNILLAGTDNDGTRTDTMMIARINTEDHTLALMSVPRDTLIRYNNGKVAKLNSVYGANGCGKKGMEALMLKLNEILGFMPSGYVLVNLDAFVELVDVIGGVDFDVPQDMYHNDPTQNLFINLSAGYQHLDGQKAMQLVRFRGYAGADIQRTKVQQEFLITVAKQCLSLSNWDKINDYISIFSRNVTTNFKAGNLVYFAQHLLECDLSDMPTYTLPGEAVWLDASYYDLYENQVAEIVAKDFSPYAD